MPAHTRLVSLDIFRGLAIAGMMLTNNPGSYEYVYPYLDHAQWHGWTPVDLVFPFFLFIMGTSLVWALDREKVKWGGPGGVAGKTIRRALILLGLGLFYNGFPNFDWPSLRIPGVLQRIALIYLLAVGLHLRLGSRGVAALMVAILLGYWGMMALLPVPGLGQPSMLKETNLVAWLDHMIMRGHLWEYDTPWDPEGLLSTLPALCIALAGLLTGRAMRARPGRCLAALTGWGAGLLLLGLLWDAWYPINKGLCTSSFVVFSSGAAILLLAACHWLADVKQQTAWARPLVVLGGNSLALYLLSEFLEKILFLVTVQAGPGGPVNLHAFLYDRFFASWLAPLHASLAWALFFLSLYLGLAWLLYRRRIFLKI
ncbi:MAG: heparan-alpha-glucosaminide N-acetyltransferase domain-containing protein [Pseudomonadota bacterium]